MPKVTEATGWAGKTNTVWFIEQTAGRTWKINYVIQIFKFLLIPDPASLSSLPTGNTFTQPSSPRQNVPSSKMPFLTFPAELVCPWIAFLVPTQEDLPF